MNKIYQLLVGCLKYNVFEFINFNKILCLMNQKPVTLNEILHFIFISNEAKLDVKTILVIQRT